MGFGSPDIASGGTPQKTLFPTFLLLLGDVTVVADHTENTISSGTSIGDLVWHVPLLHHCLLCRCLAMAASSILCHNIKAFYNITNCGILFFFLNIIF
jgi:hypothetical protein